MIIHTFALSKSLTQQIDQHFDPLFEIYAAQHQKHHIDLEALFDQTEVYRRFQEQNARHTLFTSGKGALRMISQALTLQDHKISVSYIGESAARDPQFTYFTENTKENILIKNFLAEQLHLTGEINALPHDLRLGALHQDIARARPHLADSTILFINLNALRWADAPAQSGNNPSGLTTEEANQLAYMAGQSHKNQFLVLYGLDHPHRDPHQLTLNSVVQILWYYQYAAATKPQIWPIPEDRRQDFTIESSMMSGNLQFCKDRLTNQWFHKIPFKLAPELAHHQWITTSYDEYQATANEDIPHRILEWYDIA
ncbi:hypothetical protein KUV50_07065 [Membranicola marinus]|uniref:Uncharacterized protein n=1 Tax=Membranihabitans marinus TaxID=1227546 RepID=A0A953L9Q8_9BACT|nr:hypothetical protein [Membranihabitans marinus]MBY5957883.1 hypothetical protein [Membranihabitans marinus]